MSKVRLVCGNCGKIKTIEAETAAEAFQEFNDIGWDTVYVYGYNSCEECPGASVYFPLLIAQRAREINDPELRAEHLEELARKTIEFEGVKFPAYDDSSR